MKKFAKNIVANILGWQVRRLKNKNDFKIVGVVGSIGKTSTKFAIANILSEAKKVRFQQGNYNDIVSVPLVFFNQEMPSLINIFSWIKVFIANEAIIKKPYNFEVVVLELGTDGPGQIERFANYVHCDIAVVTALSPEHMEYFKDLDSVAKEELSVSKFSDKLVINSDLCNEKYYSNIKNKLITYGKNAKVDNRILKPVFSNDGSSFEVNNIKFTMNALGIGEIYSATSAYCVAKLFNVEDVKIQNAVKSIEPVNGRMKRLKGLNKSLIIDDTYNASPVAVIASLEMLYNLKAEYKIAVLGNMNELGELSKSSHEEVGLFCNPKKVDLIITIGVDANKYLAPKALSKGCRVKSFDNPYDAGDFLKDELIKINKNIVVLAKGSQNGVFAEETVKIILENPEDANQLVRQSEYWLNIKKSMFKE